MNNEELLDLARQAAANSHSPYSKFKVGAALIADDGRVFTGANIENAAYPSSSCAEASAINTAASAGVRKIDRIAVACVDATDVDGAYPCGRCRQIMSEFDVDTILVTAGEGSDTREHTLDELLPYRFTL